MFTKKLIVVAVLALCAHIPVQAADSVHNSAQGSAASMAAVSVAPASVAVVSAYVGSVMVVESVKVVGDVVEIIFKGAANASRAVVTVTAASATAVSIGVGKTVQVVAQGTGYLLVVGGKVLCFVPGEGDQKLMRSARSS